MTDSSARITLVTSLPASPGCCAICGKSEHEIGFAATDNFDFEFYGTVYFCGDCVGEYARLFGFKSPSELDDVTAMIKAQAEELSTLRQAVVLMENTIDNLTRLSDLRSNNPDLGNLSGDLPVGVVSASSSDSTGTVSGGTQDELPLGEPDIEPRSDDVRDVTGERSDDSDIAELLAL